MGRMVRRGAIPAAISGIAIVLAIAIFARVGAAGGPQAPAPGTTSAASAHPETTDCAAGSTPDARAQYGES